MAMTFEGGFTKTYTTTITRAVGPTTRTGVRGTLPQATPTDANSIWLAKNGSDANPGTQASPKLTLSGAIAALTASLTTVHIFRNGYVGDLTFTSSTVTLPASRNIQVEQGETATIDFTGTSGARLTIGGTGCKLNGLYIYANAGTSPSNTTAVSSATSVQIENCWIENTNKNPDFGVSPSALIASGVTLNYTVLKANLGLQHSQTTTPITLNNNIFIGVNGVFNASSQVIPSVGILAGFTSASILTLVINRSLFIDLDSAVRDASIETVSPNVVSLSNCAVSRCTNTFKVILSTPGTTELFSWSLSDTYNASARNYFIDDDTTNTVTYSEVRAINPLLPMLLVDAQGGIDGDPEGFRLQRIGKDAGTSRYFITSPLSGAGLSGVDVNPWDESTGVSPTLSFESPINIIWPPSGLKPGVARFINPVELNDVQGGPHSAFDAIRRSWELSFGDGSFYANNQDLWRLVQILHDTSTQRWYPRGIGNSIFTDPSGAAMAFNGYFDGTALTFTPFISSGIPMIPKHWAGFWIIITIAGIDRHYYISDNTSSTFTLVKKLDQTVGTGVFNFRIEYIMVRFALQDLETVQEYFTRFLQGGSWGEFGTSLIDRANTLAHELKSYSIRLIEAIDPEEAV